MTSGVTQVKGITAVAASSGGTGAGTVTEIDTDATLTGGPITTTGTLGINLSNANTWPGQQTFVAPILGTPASGDASNLTGTAAGLTAGTVTTNANLTGPITSTGNATAIASQTGTGTKFVVDTSPALVTPNIGTATGTGLILTSTSATALVVGPNGTTNPAWSVNCSVASAVTGLALTSNAAGGGITLATTSTGTSDPLNINVIGNTSAAAFNVQNAGVTHFSVTPFQILLTPTAVGTAASARLGFTIPTQTTLTAGTESQGVVFTMGNTQTHLSNTAITVQRDFRVRASTHAFATSGGIITDCAAFSVDGAPVGSTNSTLTNAHAIYVPTAALTNTTNGYGLTVNAPSGAGTINAAINSIGDILVAGNVKLGTAGNGLQIKSGSNARVGTGQLTGGTQTVANTSVTANTLVFLTDTSTSITNVGSLTVVTTAGVGFVVTSTLALDTSTYNWMLVEKL